MSEDYEDDEDSPLSPDEFKEIEAENNQMINFVKQAQELIGKNDMEEAMNKLDNIKSECPICQGEIDDAKTKIKMVHEICNIEKTATDQKCQKMSAFILDNLTEFIGNLTEATEELRSEAYGENQNESDSETEGFTEED